ncbi:MAG: ATP-binding cassette domain-containing protein, partial [Candidatus Eremiobacteraeota bacterium]|nr:ATP-binding cassette domain-containing protein [Candidatus Eremiobacteraeota bacterium]
MSAAVSLHNVTVRYDGLVALDNVSLLLPYAQALGIVGPNGSGKSTLLKTIAGLLAPAQGELDVLGMAPKRLPAGSIAYVPQVEAVDWTFPASVW